MSKLKLIIIATLVLLVGIPLSYVSVEFSKGFYKCYSGKLIPYDGSCEFTIADSAMAEVLHNRLGVNLEKAKACPSTKSEDLKFGEIYRSGVKHGFKWWYDGDIVDSIQMIKEQKEIELKYFGLNPDKVIENLCDDQ